MQKFKETGDSRYIYQKQVDKACFQHDMVYWDFKDLLRRTASDKVFWAKTVNVTKNPKNDEHQKDLAAMFHNFLIKSLLTLIFQVVLLLMHGQRP